MGVSLSSFGQILSEPDSVRCFSKGSTGLFLGGLPEDEAKASSSWEWNFPRAWEVRNKDKRKFPLLEKGMLGRRVGCGLWNSTRFLRKKATHTFYICQFDFGSCRWMKRARSDLSGCHSVKATSGLRNITLTLCAPAPHNFVNSRSKQCQCFSQT